MGQVYYLSPFEGGDQLDDLIINNIVIKETTICSDGWRAYRSLNFLLYSHYTVNHSLGFIAKDTGVYIQGIESFWSKVKYRANILKGIRKKIKCKNICVSLCGKIFSQTTYLHPFRARLACISIVVSYLIKCAV